MQNNWTKKRRKRFSGFAREIARLEQAKRFAEAEDIERARDRAAIDALLGDGQPVGVNGCGQVVYKHASGKYFIGGPQGEYLNAPPPDLVPLSSRVRVTARSAKMIIIDDPQAPEGDSCGAMLPVTFEISYEVDADVVAAYDPRPLPKLGDPYPAPPPPVIEVDCPGGPVESLAEIKKLLA